ncbi:MAG: glycosyltransferase family 2 protein [Dehalococcoidia bacterium]|nr:glycosyltransferase family 2 protein [Dehalococcoidia bacterium]
MTESRKVSVIIATYNRAALLPRAVNSILAQTCQDFELLIVDDCSTDDTSQVIAAFSDSRIRAFRHETNQGLPASRNTGVAEARGEYLAFLDDDDEFTPTSLADKLAALEAAPQEVALVYGWTDMVDDATGQTRPRHRLAFEGAAAFEYALTGATLAPVSSLLVRAAAARETGIFDERLTLGEDAYFISNILSAYQVVLLRKVVAWPHEHHAYARMTDLNDSRRIGRETHYAAHLERFAAELERRSTVLAFILRLRAVNLMELRRVRDSLRWTLAAFRARPFNLGNIRHVLRLVKVFVFYVTPLSRYRERVKAMQRRLGLRKE